MAANLVLNLSQPKKSLEGKERGSMQPSPRQLQLPSTGPSRGRQGQGSLTRRDGSHRPHVDVQREKEANVAPREVVLQDIDPSR